MSGPDYVQVPVEDIHDKLLTILWLLACHDASAGARHNLQIDRIEKLSRPVFEVFQSISIKTFEEEDPRDPSIDVR